MIKMLSVVNMLGVLFQAEGPYGGTGNFQRSYFFGGGIGMWLVFLLLAIIGAAWISFDSQNRKLDISPIWKIGAYLCIGLLIPSMLFKFTVKEYQVYDYFEIKQQMANLDRYREDGWIDQYDALQQILDNQFPTLTGFIEMVLYMGVLGGIGGAGLGAAYQVSYKGVTSTSNQPVYPVPTGGPTQPPPPISRSKPPRPSKAKINAWLITREGKSHQLSQGETLIGRSSKSDIQIIEDSTISKQHAKLVEQPNGRFKLYDLGSTNGTKVNGRRVRQPVLLDADDQVKFGDNTEMKFVTS